MIYYFAIYDILLHNIWYITSWKHSSGSIGACLCKHWSMMVEALEYDVTSNRARRCKRRNLVLRMRMPLLLPTRRHRLTATSARHAQYSSTNRPRGRSRHCTWIHRFLGLALLLSQRHRSTHLFCLNKSKSWDMTTKKWKILSKDVKNLSICLVVSNYCFNFAAVNVPKTRNWNSKLKNFRIWLQWMLHVGAGVAQDLKSRESSDRMESCITIKGSAVLNDRPLFL